MNHSAELKFPSGALKSVVLLDGFEVRIGPFGTQYKVVDVPSLAKSIVRAVVSKNARLSADEITFLRERLDLLQSELAGTLGVQPQTVSLWERGAHQMPKSCDFILRQLAMEHDRIALKAVVGSNGLQGLAKITNRPAVATYFATRSSGSWQVQAKLQFGSYFAASETTASLAEYPRQIRGAQPANAFEIETNVVREVANVHLSGFVRAMRNAQSDTASVTHLTFEGVTVPDLPPSIANVTGRNSMRRARGVGNA